jgi:hypothetical protein
VGLKKVRLIREYLKKLKIENKKYLIMCEVGKGK